ncbi:HMA2 domain-containing protein [Geobacter sp. DSM 9736]|uniref:HMA2 domain-containing protein n=1 Tax=Geobacter sp. DSM 9736 TaxID=1277350 RepID=UPI000B50BD64|nr:hypothetical protein SAMN06269301_0919 [Geobacter sp. DSM 9736]
MAPLSVLPGRVRFETKCLIGCRMKCLHLEEVMGSKQGVIAVSASHRTGSVLVKYDESLVSRSNIEVYVGEALVTVSAEGNTEMVHLPALRKPSFGRDSTINAGHIVMEFALHTLLPAPLDFLLPAAASVLRR